MQKEIGKLDLLLKQVDPDGFFKEGTRAADVAKQKGLRLYNKAKDDEALTKQRKLEQVYSIAGYYTSQLH